MVCRFELWGGLLEKRNTYDDHSYDGYIHLHSFDFAISGGIDIAFPIGKSVNFGVYSSWGNGIGYDLLLVGAGPLMLINFRGGGSLYFGGGWSGTFPSYFYHDDNGMGFGARLGYKFRGGFYLFGEYNHTSYDYYYHWGRSDAFLLHLGYSF